MASRGYIASNGYRRVWVIGHGEQYEHRAVMEAQLGRALLPDEHVHHRNGDKLDNRVDNLEVLSKSEHLRRHAHTRIRVSSSCSNCGQLAKPLRRGRCNACSIYLRLHGVERPARLFASVRVIRNQWGECQVRSVTA